MPSLFPLPLRHRAVAAGLLAGVLVGSLAGAVARAPAPTRPPRARILHAAPVLAVPGAPVDLRFVPVCEPVESPACDVRAAALHVRSAGAWTSVPGTVEGGEATFRVPGELVTEAGFAYHAELTSATGAVFRYPPSGARHPIAVASTAGFRRVAVPADLSLDEVRSPDATELFLPWGSGPGEVGRTRPGPGAEPLGPSSFAVGPSGEIVVADWVNGRVAIFPPRGPSRELRLPERTTVDVAVGADGRIGLVGLGVGARAWELAPDGRSLGSYPLPLGAPARVAAGDDLRAMVAPGQWVPVRSPGGEPLAPTQQDAGRAASPTGVRSQELGEDRFAAAWPSAGGGTVGALVALPAGINVGLDYFVQPLGDGGALVARGLWDDTRMAVGVFRFSPRGELLDLSLLPEPSTRMDARFSTVRFAPPGAVLAAYDRPDGLAIERFEVIA
jgi:hypothetical protein